MPPGGVRRDEDARLGVALEIRNLGLARIIVAHVEIDARGIRTRVHGANEHLATRNLAELFNERKKTE